MEIEIPSPSVFLKKSPIIRPVPDPPPGPVKKQPSKPRPNTAPKGSTKPGAASSTTQDGAITKPKQSKSRNGCMTCKKKRLKCDETKPTCQQCAKRNVECEGYKKDYKWRSFEETNFNPKPAAKATKKHSRSLSFNPDEVALPRPISQAKSDDAHAASSWSPSGLSTAFADAKHAFQPPTSHDDMDQTSGPLDPALHDLPSFDYNDFPGDGLDPYSLPGPRHPSSLADDGSANSAGSGESIPPHLLDMPPLGTDMDQSHDHRQFDNFLMDEEFNDEFLQRHISPMTVNPIDTTALPPRRNSRAASNASSHSSKTSTMTVMAKPEFDPASPEMLMLRFDKSTCGILSIKDGPNENPWRNLVWPLARDSPALYHAIASMTAFHGRQDYPNLRVPGIYHMRKSLAKLSENMDVMRPDAKLATSLVLAFGEGWDETLSTGVQHLRGAKAMVIHAVNDFQQRLQAGQLSTREAIKWRFLCNTFVYMDVISRLTNLEETPDGLIDDIVNTVNQPIGDLLDVDPLMGCAVSLFPIIGRVNHLIQGVRRSDRIPLNTVTQAEELRNQLEQWQPANPAEFERPDDVTSEVMHAIQTAEAYRYATLLYLHQAVPEIPSFTCEALARKVMLYLASVPVSSRTIIIQIFPLLAAGCELTEPDDQEWVSQRWASMMLRLKIGNVDSCWDITREIWARRAQYEADKKERMMRRFNARAGHMAQQQQQQQQQSPQQQQGGVGGGNNSRNRNRGGGGADDFVPAMMGGGAGPQQQRARTGDFSGGDDSNASNYFDMDNNGGGGSNSTGHSPGNRSGHNSPLKPSRRTTFDTMSTMAPPSMGIGMGMGMAMGNVSTGRTGRRPPAERVVDLLEDEYMVRGRLHWLGLMAERDWESKSSLSLHLCSLLHV
ncbi:uncharacterized protein HMPREF1541_04290 [Cyphellophora europaea CBS 101466]|uniref:Zn(2)-C6 fungal-type domain-containing protein n=1 Tax=Cyphellophora europaea (strain CBS 101466) TaxID=1220924 RepID=W2RUN2_CYPE1|nr:uncharacterized protein HMPREF1541_04290 [Cyphellophora europaea CBS 101466]ETN40015.1 hypothetical protein HMPREF1541_04290 [Cyphellophora europaea CBS 101466]